MNEMLSCSSIVADTQAAEDRRDSSRGVRGQRLLRHLILSRTTLLPCLRWRKVFQGNGKQITAACVSMGRESGVMICGIRLIVHRTTAFGCIIDWATEGFDPSASKTFHEMLRERVQELVPFCRI